MHKSWSLCYAINYVNFKDLTQEHGNVWYMSNGHVLSHGYKVE